jgi:hypothetical protein
MIIVVCSAFAVKSTSVICINCCVECSLVELTVPTYIAVFNASRYVLNDTKI